MTSKAERTAVRNSYRFMVGNESEVNTTSESESDALNETLLNQSWNIRGHSLQIELRKKPFVEKKINQKFLKEINRRSTNLTDNVIKETAQIQASSELIYSNTKFRAPSED